MQDSSSSQHPQSDQIASNSGQVPSQSQVPSSQRDTKQNQVLPVQDSSSNEVPSNTEKQEKDGNETHRSLKKDQTVDLNHNNSEKNADFEDTDKLNLDQSNSQLLGKPQTTVHQQTELIQIKDKQEQISAIQSDANQSEELPQDVQSPAIDVEEETPPEDSDNRPSESDAVPEQPDRQSTNLESIKEEIIQAFNQKVQDVKEVQLVPDPSTDCFGDFLASYENKILYKTENKQYFCLFDADTQKVSIIHQKYPMQVQSASFFNDKIVFNYVDAILSVKIKDVLEYSINNLKDSDADQQFASKWASQDSDKDSDADPDSFPQTTTLFESEDEILGCFISGSDNKTCIHAFIQNQDQYQIVKIEEQENKEFTQTDVLREGQGDYEMMYRISDGAYYLIYNRETRKYELLRIDDEDNCEFIKNFAKKPDIIKLNGELLVLNKDNQSLFYLDTQPNIIPLTDKPLHFGDIVAISTQYYSNCDFNYKHGVFLEFEHGLAHISKDYEDQEVTYIFGGVKDKYGPCIQLDDYFLWQTSDEFYITSNKKYDEWKVPKEISLNNEKALCICSDSTKQFMAICTEKYEVFVYKNMNYQFKVEGRRPKFDHKDNLIVLDKSYWKGYDVNTGKQVYQLYSEFDSKSFKYLHSQSTYLYKDNTVRKFFDFDRRKHWISPCESIVVAYMYEKAMGVFQIGKDGYLEHIQSFESLLYKIKSIRFCMSEEKFVMFGEDNEIQTIPLYSKQRLQSTGIKINNQIQNQYGTSLTLNDNKFVLSSDNLYHSDYDSNAKIRMTEDCLSDCYVMIGNKLKNLFQTKYYGYNRVYIRDLSRMCIVNYTDNTSTTIQLDQNELKLNFSPLATYADLVEALMKNPNVKDVTLFPSGFNLFHYLWSTNQMEKFQEYLEKGTLPTKDRFGESIFQQVLREGDTLEKTKIMESLHIISDQNEEESRLSFRHLQEQIPLHTLFDINHSSILTILHNSFDVISDQFQFILQQSDGKYGIEQVPVFYDDDQLLAKRQGNNKQMNSQTFYHFFPGGREGSAKIPIQVERCHIPIPPMFTEESIRWKEYLSDSIKGDLFKAKIINTLINDQWNTFTFWLAFGQTMFMISHLLILIYLFWPNYSDGDNTTSFNITRKIVISMTIIQLLFEFLEFIVEGKKYLNFSNIADAFTEILVLGVLFYQKESYGDNSKLSYQIVVFMFLCLWMLVISKYLTIFEPIRHLLQLVAEVIQSMFVFLALLFIYIMSLAHLLIVLSQMHPKLDDDEKPVEMTQAEIIQDSIMVSYAIGYGELLDGFSQMSWIQTVVFVYYTLLIPLTLFNLLIAIISDRFEEVMANRVEFDCRAILVKTIEFERIYMFFKKMFKINKPVSQENEFMYVRSVANHDGEEEDWTGMFGRLSSQIKRTFKEVKEIKRENKIYFEKIDEKMGQQDKMIQENKQQIISTLKDEMLAIRNSISAISQNEDKNQK